MLRDYVDGADQMQDVLDRLFHVSSSSSKLFVSNPVKGCLIFDILFRRQDITLVLPLCLLRASRSFRNFPICDSSKEGMCRTDQLRLEILPSRRWSPRWWRTRTWGTAQFASIPSKSATRSCFFLSSQILQLFLMLADPVSWLPWVASPRLSPWLPSTMALEVSF